MRAANLTPQTTRKSMRKGTRSCYECRRRKVRCIFTKDSTVCEGCTARGKRCTEQSRELLQDAALETRESLRERVARLEAIIKASSSASRTPVPPELNSRSPQIDESGLQSSSASVATASTPSSVQVKNSPVLSDKGSPQSIDPLVTLFDNAIWRRNSTDMAQDSMSFAKSDEVKRPKDIHVREALLAGVIPSELLSMILSATCSWWHTWRPLGPWLSASMGDQNISTLQDFVFWALESPKPSVIGLGLLCIAICLQELDARIHQYIIRQFPRLPGELFQEYFEKVDRLILNDSDYAGTEEGIQATILCGKIYMNLGLNKKCWILLHRAIAHSQLLNFHRPECYSPGENETSRHRRIQSWLALCSGDVYTSLLLGLPYAADGRTIPLTYSQRNATSLLQHKLILLSAQVIDRNQTGMSLSVSRTEEIQKEIEAATKDLDHTFWDSPAALAASKITRQEYLEQTAAQCWLYHLLVLLHMPLMIHSVEDAGLEKNRIACLEASRKLLKTYHIMRSDAFSAFSMIKLIDYQAFVCSALLVLGILGYGGSIAQVTDPDKDRDLIRLTISILRQASGSANNSIASQAVIGLEGLMLLNGGGCQHTEGPEGRKPYARIVVPQIGTITISPGEYYEKSQLEPKSHDKLPLPPPIFSLSQETFLGMPGQANQFPVLATNTEIDGGQANGLGFGSGMEPELPSLDFDWTSNITPSFENDWAWLNDMTF